jgi:prepilin-type N-terminal cleavage/methylation domain-containing protein
MRRPTHTDAGFTLPELLVTIVITSIIVGAIGVAFTTFFRNETYSRRQVGSTRDTLSLATWLPADVHSTVATGGVDVGASTGTGCANSPGYDANANRNVLRLTMTDASTATTSYAAYRAELIGGQWTLRRYACTANTVPTVVAVVRYLRDDSAAVVIDTGSRLGLRVTTSVEGQEGSFEVVGTRRTPSSTSTTSPPPTSPPTSRPPN